jgi:hypothetical protein
MLFIDGSPSGNHGIVVKNHPCTDILSNGRIGHAFYLLSLKSTQKLKGGGVY